MNNLPRMLLTGVLAGVILCSATSAPGQATRAPSAVPETPEARQTRLLSALKSPELTAEKAAAFEELAAFGSSEVIPILAPLLADEKLAHYARIALEANPDPAVDALLRKSLDQLTGNLLIGVINSIGVRRDGPAVAALTAKLVDENAEVSAAAAHALGCISTPEAAAALTTAMTSSAGDRRAGVARGCLVCAENLNKAANRDQAIAMYDVVRGAEVPEVIRLAGLRGAILTRGTDGIALLVEQLKGGEPAAVDAALRAARELRTEKIWTALLDCLGGSLKPETEVRVILTIGDLRTPKEIMTTTVASDGQTDPASPAEMKVPMTLDGVPLEVAPQLAACLVASESVAVRAAALCSLKKVGDARVIPALWPFATGSDTQLAELAKDTLAALQGESVDAEVQAHLEDSSAASRALVIELIGLRRINAAVPQLLKLVSGSDAANKSAALRALGETASLAEMPVLVSEVIAAHSDAEKTLSQAALTAACVRMPDRDACAKMLTAKLAAAPAESKTVLLEQLGAMGGPVALACLKESAQDTRADTQDAATRILGTWIGSDVGPVLLDLAKTIRNDTFKFRVLRGYIRIASQFGLPHDEKMDMCTKALAVAQRNDERDLVLNVLAGDPSPVALRIAMTQLNNPELKAKVAGVAVGIAQTAMQDDPQAVVEAMQQVVRAGVGGDTEVRAKSYLERAQKLQ